jgi:hypothetical protein
MQGLTQAPGKKLQTRSDAKEARRQTSRNFFTSVPLLATSPLLKLLDTNIPPFSDAQKNSTAAAAASS